MICADGMTIPPMQRSLPSMPSLNEYKAFRNTNRPSSNGGRNILTLRHTTSSRKSFGSPTISKAKLTKH
jgi:hypothetical protein